MNMHVGQMTETISKVQEAVAAVLKREPSAQEVLNVVAFLEAMPLIEAGVVAQKVKAETKKSLTTTSTKTQGKKINYPKKRKKAVNAYGAWNNPEVQQWLNQMMNGDSVSFSIKEVIEIFPRIYSSSHAFAHRLREEAKKRGWKTASVKFSSGNPGMVYFKALK